MNLQRAEPETSERWKAHAALLFVQIAFGSQAVEAKIAMQPVDAGGAGIEPLALAMIRMLGAAAFFQAFSRLTGQLRPTGARDHASLFGLSVLGITLNQALFLIGLRMTTPVSAALLSVSIPITTAGLAMLAGQERPSLRTWAGLACATVGVLFLTGFQSFDQGAAVVAANSLAYSAYLVLARGTLRRLGPITVLTWIFTWGALSFSPIGLAALRGAAAWDARAWGFAVFMVLVPTIGAYVANAWALVRTPATVVTAYIPLQPILTAALAWVQLGTGIPGRAGMAACLIAAGLFFVVRR